MDCLTDKLSIKSLLFTKVIPNLIVPIPVNGHKVYGCTDCGDKFIFESSYDDHINRKSIKITYMCRHCNQLKVFFNRCNLLHHIRSHAFKTATINVTDLKVESLPLTHFKTKPSLSSTSTSGTKQITITKPLSSPILCYECKADVTVTGIAYKDRATHLMQYTNEVYSCPVCLFALPSICALKVHLRLHLKCPPYYCPECGIHLINKNVQYPYNHDCEGFKMMRATARLNCSVPDCSLFHPNDYKEHMTKYHLKKVFKCPFCVVACFNESTMEKHLKGHKTGVRPLLFYQCDVCPGRYVLQNPKLNEQHLKSHIKSTIFPCWACGSAFKEVSSLVTHYVKKHNKSEAVNVALSAILNDNSVLQLGKPKRIYRVVKRCEQCKRSFTYKCKYEEIQVLPNECPFKCTSTMDSNVTPDQLESCTDNHITCHMCQVKIPEDWTEIKKHYAALHKTHKCLDAKILLTRIDIKKYLFRKRIGRPRLRTKTLQKISKQRKYQQQNKLSTPLVTDNELISIHQDTPEIFECNMCSSKYNEKSMLEKHILLHRDPYMAYQCMECAQSFVVKPSFAKHLLLEHDITDADDYIKNNQCYNEDALLKHQNSAEISELPVRENQCRICREEFEDPEDLEKHFRVHGMAFLMKSTLNKNI